MMTQHTRIESDFLGEQEISNDAYYEVQSLRAKDNVQITSHLIKKDLIRALGIVKKAAAIANFKVGYLEEDKKNAIVQAAEEIIEGKHVKEFIVDSIQGGAGTSMNMNANEVIANRALEI